jgi:hypothetical protein
MPPPVLHRTVQRGQGEARRFNEEPASKLEASLLAGIFVGEEIYCTGRVHTPIQKSVYNIFGSSKFSGASSGAWTPATNQPTPPQSGQGMVGSAKYGFYAGNSG